MKTNEPQKLIRPGFLVGLFALFIIIPAFLSGSVGGKPTTILLVHLACRDFLRYTKSVSTNGEFKGDFSKLPDSGKWSSGGTSLASTTPFANESELRKARIYEELYASARAIFNPNQNFWAKTNFVTSASKAEPVILCKQEFLFPRPRNLYGCRIGWRRAAYVVGYSNETVRYVSKEEFNNLSLNGFVPLSTLGVEGFHARFTNEELPKR